MPRLTGRCGERAGTRHVFPGVTGGQPVPGVFGGDGAGLIQLPVLIFLGLPFAVALATHKVASIALGIGATIRHLREAPLERHLVTPILAFGLPGVIVGANVILSVPRKWLWAC